MELRQLRYAWLLAEERHFGRAAARAWVTTSALSQQIAKLERELGSTLFRRDHSPIQLTAAGEAFIAQAQLVLAQVGELERDMAALVRRGTGILRIGVFGAGLGELTPLLIGGFREAIGGVRLEFTELSMTNQLSALDDDEVDVALLHLPFDTPDVEFVPMFDEPRYATLPRNHDLADASELTLADLADERFVAGHRDIHERWRTYWDCSEVLGGPARTEPEMGSVTEGLNAVAYLGRVDTAPASGTRYFQHPGVRFVRLRDASPATAVVARKRDNHDPAALAFLRFAEELADSWVGTVPEASAVAR